ncbi:hypothetical protein GJ744_004495 [Endocarpon pusillum]|uniref:Glucose-methanol-choline oxidoreductase N-terminal domain-containing protein n=1 Tax=Endocarpon pusillum TaxID=364733 RepID=A0A8H7ARJ9_9EURO|nr:hypothetical protein GJ744_004495 [Endocarpon pusillum]
MGLIAAVISALLAWVTVTTSAPTPNFERTAHNVQLVSSFGIPGRNYTFDYLVIGGGQAGLTIAARLAANSSLQIGVVEAGTFSELTNGNLSQVPFTASAYVAKDVNDWQPGIDWGFVTAPQQGVLNASQHYARGKCLGGNSVRNYMIYHVGSAGSYQMWADQVGDDSYSFENFLPYFQRSQKFTPPDQSRRPANATPRYDPSVLGRDGPLSVIYPNYAGAFGSWAERGLAAVGIGPIDGFQSGKLIGSGQPLSTINYDRNVRESSETAFLDPKLVDQDPNLIVFPSTMAKRIIFDSDKRATGVEVDTGGLKYVLNAGREVIVSAGSFQSPQLLMVSGVGPAETLNEHGIDVISDLPGVGQNMEDHILFGTTYRVNLVTGSAFANPQYASEAIQQFRQGYGPLTSLAVDMLGWEKLPRNTSNLSVSALTDLATFAEDWPEVEYFSPGGYVGNSTILGEGIPRDGYNYAGVAAGLVAPLSRGSVSIISNDTSDLPIINPNWLSHPTDRAVAIASFKRTRAIWESEVMREITIGEEYFPGKALVSTDEEILRYIQTTFESILHASCTCKMGRTGDPNAVVDTKARVFGVEGLRVVDASALPLLPPGHPMATIYALAEKIADDILNGR